MKKLFLMAALAVATLSVNAQTWIGGQLGYSNSKVKDADDAENTWSIAPEIGYNLNDSWAIAAALNYTGTKFGDVKANVFSFNPYVRYNAASYGDVTFFIDGSVAAGFGKNETPGQEDVETTAIAAGFKPGIAYSICDKFGLVAHFGFLGYEFYKEDDAKTNTFSFNFTNNITFGVYVNL